MFASRFKLCKLSFYDQYAPSSGACVCNVCVCVRACVRACVCARARARACVRACVDVLRIVSTGKILRLIEPTFLGGGLFYVTFCRAVNVLSCSELNS